MEAHNQLEELIIDRATFTAKKEIANKFADLVYEGKWFTRFVKHTRHSFSPHSSMLPEK